MLCPNTSILRNLSACSFLLTSLFISSGLFGGETAKAAAEEQPAPVVEESDVVTTHHAIELKGKTIKYTANTGKLVLKNRKGEPTAEIFYIAYTKDEEQPEDRPLTFSFNGGPGSSSVWLHMGILGPKRVILDKDGFALPPPHMLGENPFSLLDETDLVFIDPVSTGFSKPVDFEKEKEFHGLQEDVESVGEFIRRYVTDNARWSSPKFLIGESYGTTRASALSQHLQKAHGMYLNGIMLVSAVLDFATIRYSEDNDSPYIYFLPSMAATSRYHKRIDKTYQDMSIEEFTDEVEQFSISTYQQALFAGDRLSAKDTQSVAKQLSEYTGISEKEILKNRLKLDVWMFFEQLLEDQGKMIGRFDGRYVGISALPWEYEQGVYYDPSYHQIYGAYSSAFNDYVRRDLGYENDAPYKLLTNVRPWNFGEEFKARYVNVSIRLREALVMNPHMKVHVCAGYYDLATPYFAAEATFDRMLLHPDVRDNYEFSYYEAGHMMYTVEEELKKQKAALGEFIRKAK